MANELATEQINKYNDLVSTRKQERDDDWQIIAQYALPQDSNITQTKTEGVSGWTDRIFDTTTIQAVETLAAGLYNWWTPQNQPWNEYELPETLKEGDGAEDAKQWLGKASEKSMKEMGRSNFYMAKATGDTGLATFATDLILCDESEGTTEMFNFIHVKIGTYVIEEDYKGIVDTVRREIEMTYRQIEQKFSKTGDTIPEKMKTMAKGEKGRAKKFKILHCIFPREDSKRLPGRKDGPHKPIASVFISIDFRETIRISGYDESPILCRRFKKWATVWGYGPCYLALPDSRQVNYVQQYMDANAELHADPRVLIPDNLDGDVDLRAGGVTVYDSNQPNAVPKEWLTASEYKLGLEMQQQRRQAIRDACYTDAFKLLNSSPLLDKEMTAYEISQRQAEQLQNMTPVDARHINEFHNPLMRRVFGVMYRRGALGQAPQALMQQTGVNKVGLAMPEVQATSRFQDALKALKNRGREAAFTMGLKLAGVKPEILDVLDTDSTYRDYCRDSGVGADNIRKIKGPNSVESLRANRAKLAQQQRQAQMAEQLGKAGKALGGSPEWMQDQVKEQAQGGGKGQAA